MPDSIPRAFPGLSVLIPTSLWDNALGFSRNRVWDEWSVQEVSEINTSKGVGGQAAGLEGQRQRDAWHCHVAAAKVTAETWGLERPFRGVPSWYKGARVLHLPMPLSGQRMSDAPRRGVTLGKAIQPWAAESDWLSILLAAGDRFIRALCWVGQSGKAARPFNIVLSPSLHEKTEAPRV